ncbi:MAG TPA: hypothetical protein VFX26_02845 [Nitrososphaeraceae archaeon]|nr:hypothetical protein [Nitrososphaeraceae archaeon]
MKQYKIRTGYFLILSLAIMFVASQGTSSSYIYKSWADEPLILDNIIKNYYVKIQDKSENGLVTSSEIGQDSKAGNETGSDLDDQALSGLEDTDGGNDTSTEASTESESNQNTNQTIVTQQQQQTQNNQTVNIQNNIEMKQKLEIAISEEEGEAPISIEEQNRIESIDRDIVTQHKALTGPDCKSGNVLAGASNAEDLRVLTECQDAIGTVMHTKKMDDGDYKFFLNLDEQFKFLVNDKNNEKTDGFLVVEIVPPDQNLQGVYLPKDGDRVHVWGAWVTDKPKGWHEIHPTWKVVNQ